MSETEILIEFKSQLVAFFDELIGQFPEQGDLVVVRLFLSTQIPIKDVMDELNFRINTNNQELKKMIKERNETFFLDHNLFDILGKEKVSIFKHIWRSNQLDSDDKKIIWEWIDTFIYFAEKYTKVISIKQ